MQKILLLLLLVLEWFMLSAQDSLSAKIAFLKTQANPVASVEISDGNLVGYNFWDKIAKEKNILLLGEKGHYDARSIKAICKSIKYLHEKHGYNLLVIEQNYYLIEKLFALDNWKPFVKQLSINTDIEVLDFYKYLHGEKKNGMRVVGMDITLGQMLRVVDSFCVDLKRKWKLAMPKDTSIFPLIDTLHFQATNLHTKRYTHSQVLSTIALARKEALHKQVGQDYVQLMDYFWGVMSKNAEEDELYLKARTDSLAYDTYLSMSKRDYYMSQNLDYILKKHKGEKIIVWASAQHISRNTQLLLEGAPYFRYQKTMWDYLDEGYSRESYSVAFTYYRGKGGIMGRLGDPFVDSEGRKSFTYQKKMPLNAMEEMLAKTGYKFCFLDFNQLKRLPDNPIRPPFWMSPSFKNAICTNWYEVYDGIFFTEEMMPVIVEVQENWKFFEKEK